MLVYKKGDLLNAHEDVIAHGCNAQGVMGSGVAKAIRDKWPSAYDAYRETYETKGLHLGDVIMCQVGDKLIANCITQENYGRDGEMYVNYDAISKCIENLLTHCDRNAIESVAIPKIGAGLGGGDWLLIEGIIKEIQEQINTVKVVVYEL